MPLCFGLQLRWFHFRVIRLSLLLLLLLLFLNIMCMVRTDVTLAEHHLIVTSAVELSVVYV